MRNTFLLCFLLALPSLAVAGHDLWLVYNREDMELPPPFYLSDLGWLWVQYAPGSYDWARENVDADLWQSAVEPLLRQTTLWVTAIPAAAIYALLLVMRAFAWGPYAGQMSIFGRQKKSDFAFGSDAQAKGRVKYKRK